MSGDCPGLSHGGQAKRFTVDRKHPKSRNIDENFYVYLVHSQLLYKLN